MNAEPVVSVRIVIKRKTKARVINSDWPLKFVACSVEAMVSDWIMLRTMVR